MIEVVDHTKQYFQAPVHYFWHWEENGDVISWVDGPTICYRDDLVEILRQADTKTGLPMGTLLLLLSACIAQIEMKQEFFLFSIQHTQKDETLNQIYSRAIRFLELISQLPAELRKGTARAHLIHELCGMADPDTSVDLRESRFKKLITELGSGRLDGLILQKGPEVSISRFKNDLLPLARACEKFETKDRLESFLRTGVSSPPAAAPIEIPERSPKDIFDQLSDNPETLPLARLAKRIVAALNIPMHSKGSGDQSYGGISDITNRGNYDKLLLSELAHDDSLLMARLVNNEALYFRREEPPENPQRQRTLLIDSTLRMWGTPRIFALATALACAHNTKHDEAIEVYALGQENYVKAAIDSPQAILAVMGAIDKGLHCGVALQQVISDMPATAFNDYFLITDEYMLSEPGFTGYLSGVKESLSFILTVNRNGALACYECIKGRTKLLTTAKLDLEELLFSKPIKANSLKIKMVDESLGAFFKEYPSALLCPRSRLSQLSSVSYCSQNVGAITITKNQRVLIIESPRRAAIEVIPFIPKGTYWFGEGDFCFYIILWNEQRGLAKFFRIDTNSFEVKEVDISEEFKIERIYYVKFVDHLFAFQLAGKRRVFDCKQEKFITELTFSFSNADSDIPRRSIEHQKRLNEYFDYQHNISYKFSKVFINKDLDLILGGFKVKFIPDMEKVRIDDYYHEETFLKEAVEAAAPDFPGNKYIKLRKWFWPDGTRIMADSRGFLYLKSSNTSLPEVVIVLAVQTNTACWSSDGKACGATEFIDERKVSVISVTEFHKRYIAPLIKQIVAG